MTITGEIDKTAAGTMMEEIEIDLRKTGAFLSGAEKLMYEAVCSSTAENYPKLDVISTLLKKACKQCDELHDDVQRYGEALDERQEKRVKAGQEQDKQKKVGTTTTEKDEERRDKDAKLTVTEAEYSTLLDDFNEAQSLIEMIVKAEETNGEDTNIYDTCNVVLKKFRDMREIIWK